MKEQIGVIGVDAGLCWIGDPCYIMGTDATEQPAATWAEFCKKLTDNDFQQWNFKLGHPGLGVSVSTGHGDGTYPVFIERGYDGRVKRVIVEF